MRLELEGQVALITGAGGGIGRAIALELASAGANVVVAEKISERAEETAEAVRALGRRALPQVLDVADVEAVQMMVEAARTEFGRIDILVNNAGGTGKRAFLDTSPNSWRRHIDLNLTSLFACTHAAAPVMIAGRRGGAIVNVSSIEASRAAPMFAAYAACKAGMNNFTRTMALELADHGIRVNAIAPDYTRTPGLSGNVAGPVDETQWHQPSPAQADLVERRIPLRRAGLPEECGKAALFLVSSASSYVTGTVLPVDGGSWASSGWLRDQQGRWVLGEETL